jgi:hypothetical protein
MARISKTLAAPLGTLLALALAAPAARAAGVGDHSLMISADRLFGVANSKTSMETTNAENSVSRTNVSLLASSPESAYSIPRLAVDVTLLGGLTLGGAVGFATGSSSVKSTAGTASTEVDGPDVTSYLLAPRVGWVLPLGGLAGLWLRGGVTYFRSKSKSDTTIVNVPGSNSTITSGFSANLEPTLTLMPADSFGFAISLVADLPLTGSQTSERVRGSVTTTTDNDVSVRNIGIMVGVFGRI